jgi:O-methyltransferase
LATLLSHLAHRLTRYLLRPAVRYKYLPELYQLISYNRKEQILYTCLEYAALAEVKGDYLEFGMWKGGSMIAAYHLSRQLPGLSDMRFYGFDSFEGIPTLTVNKHEAKEFPPGVFSGGLDEVRKNLVQAKVEMSKVELIPGWYSDTLNDQTKQKLPLRAAAVVNVDCDVYESTVPVLDFIEPYLVDGSIIIFDDWYCFANREEQGEQKAFSEWLQRNRHLKATPYKEFGWDGKAFIINQLSPKQSSIVSSAVTAIGNPGTSVLQEHEYVLDYVNDSVIARTLQGRINFWNRRAEELYGWKKEEAIGRVSHNLLQTQFPKPLEEIDTELVENGRWKGKLVHTTRDGGKVLVESQWNLELDGKSGAVVEVNRRSADS